MSCKQQHAQPPEQPQPRQQQQHVEQAAGQTPLLLSVLLLFVPVGQLLLLLSMLRPGLFGIAVSLPVYGLAFHPAARALRYTGTAIPRSRDRTAVLVILTIFIGGSSFIGEPPIVRSLLAQGSRGRVDGVADGFARHEKFHSPVLLTPGGIVVRRYRQCVPKSIRTTEPVATPCCTR